MIVIVIIITGRLRRIEPQNVAHGPEGVACERETACYSYSISYCSIVYYMISYHMIVTIVYYVIIDVAHGPEGVACEHKTGELAKQCGVLFQH